MNKPRIESAVELGLRVFHDEDVPTDTIVHILREATFDMVQEVFYFETAKIGLACDISFEEFVDKYDFLPTVIKTQFTSFSDWFRVGYVSQEFLPPESGFEGTTDKNDSKQNIDNFVHEGKKEALVKALERLGYKNNELKLTVGDVSQGWGRLPYCYIDLPDKNKKILFCNQSRRGTYVVDMDADISKPKSSFEDDLIIYHYKRPHVYELLLIEKIDKHEFEKISVEIIEKLKLKFGLSDFLKLEINQIEDLFTDDLTLKQFARYCLKIDIGTDFKVEDKIEMAKAIWPESNIEVIENMADEDLISALKCIYPSFADMVFSSPADRSLKILNGYTLQNIATRLGVSERIIKPVGIWELVEVVYGITEDEYSHLIREKYKSLYSREEFARLHLKDVSNFTIFDGRLGVKKIYNIVFGETIGYFSDEKRGELMNWIWSD